MLEINNLYITFGSGDNEKTAVKDVSIQQDRNSSLGIVGESGSGKSLTALSIMKLLPPQAIIKTGKIIFDGSELTSLGNSEIRKFRGNRISMIFQEPMTALNPVMRCGKQVVDSIVLHQKINRKKARLKVIELFKKVNLPRPEHIYRSYPHELSGGQKQRIMIAMAIANNPELLIADEPTTALDVTVQKEILALLKSLKDEYGMGLIFISHDLGVINEVADNIAVMYKGEIVEYGKKEDIFKRPKHNYTKGLLACRPDISMKSQRLPELDDFIYGEVMPNNLPSVNNPEAFKSINQNPILKVDHLEKKYPLTKNIWGKTLKSISAVDNVSFDVFPGETLGLVGESGCGKTTLSRSILRLIEPSGGKIYFDQKNMVEFSQAEMKKQRKSINIIFQDPYSSLNPRMCVGEAIVEPMKVHNLNVNNKLRKGKALELLEKVGLKHDHYYRYPHEFSGGQRQRVVIARTLALNPKFIICDEAVSALDVSVQAKVLNLLNDLKTEFGFTYIFISHDLNVVRYMSDRIMVMRDGKIVEIGNAEEIYNNPKTDYTKMLIDAIPFSG